MRIGSLDGRERESLEKSFYLVNFVTTPKTKKHFSLSGHLTPSISLSKYKPPERCRIRSCSEGAGRLRISNKSNALEPPETVNIYFLLQTYHLVPSPLITPRCNSPNLNSHIQYPITYPSIPSSTPLFRTEYVYM